MRRSVLALLVGLALAAGAGSARAQGRTIGVQGSGPADAAGYYADSWAVVIGINDYQHPRIPRLRYAVNDARAVERALLAQGMLGEIRRRNAKALAELASVHGVQVRQLPDSVLAARADADFRRVYTALQQFRSLWRR